MGIAGELQEGRAAGAGRCAVALTSSRSRGRACATAGRIIPSSRCADLGKPSTAHTSRS